MIVRNKGSWGHHRDLMNHRMETIFWLTKHSDFVLSVGCKYSSANRNTRRVYMNGMKEFTKTIWEKSFRRSFCSYRRFNWTTYVHSQQTRGTPALEGIRVGNKSIIRSNPLVALLLCNGKEKVLSLLSVAAGCNTCINVVIVYIVLLPFQ